MTEAKMKKLEIRRMRDAIEVRRAKRDAEMAEWFKYIAAMILIVVLVVCGYLIVREGQRRAEEEREKVEAMREARQLSDEAVGELVKNPHNGLAWVALLIGSAIANGGAK